MSMVSPVRCVQTPTGQRSGRFGQEKREKKLPYSTKQISVAAWSTCVTTRRSCVKR